MSVQFGICNFDGKPVDPADLEQVRPLLVPYGPDSEGFICTKNLGILYRAFHTTRESHREAQPSISPSGAVITWDGRLDNRKELISHLTGELSDQSSDLDIVAAAYERWRSNAFAKLVGDWALSIWDPSSRSLILAKDFSGTRHLYYSVGKDKVTWCTILDPLVLFSGRSFELEEEYIAGWLSYFPATHLTPYVGIHAVPPSSMALFGSGKQQIKQYWDFDPGKKIRYSTDSQYEEHFRIAFANSVRRRLRSDNSVIAELSGGIDSSSIVCMADHLIAAGEAHVSSLDTISYYDDSEPNWNERPYFTKVEEKRGRTGFHIDVGSQCHLLQQYEPGYFAATLGSGGQRMTAGDPFGAILGSQSARILLSGIGGDEVLGGVPTPTPELADLVATAELRKLGKQVFAWSLAKRKPLFYLLAETIQTFLLQGGARSTAGSLAGWLEPQFMRRYRTALQGYPRRVRLFGALPSFQENINTLDVLRRQLASSPLPRASIHETRYTYLDRDLLEYLYAIPREQIIRPHQRRSLMRRALVGIVPDEILNRRRKAFVVRAPMIALAAEWTRLRELSEDMVSVSSGMVNSRRFGEALQRARQGAEIHLTFMMRTLEVECWLRHLASWNLWKPSVPDSKSPAPTSFVESSAS